MLYVRYTALFKHLALPSPQALGRDAITSNRHNRDYSGPAGRIPHRLIARLRDLKSPTILDMPCGAGDITEMVKEALPHGVFHGLDIQALPDGHHNKLNPDITFIQHDILNSIPTDTIKGFPSGGYDAVYVGRIRDSIATPEKLDRVYQNLHQVLAPNGLLSVREDQIIPIGKPGHTAQFKRYECASQFLGNTEFVNILRQNPLFKDIYDTYRTEQDVNFIVSLAVPDGKVTELTYHNKTDKLIADLKAGKISIGGLAMHETQDRIIRRICAQGFEFVEGVKPGESEGYQGKGDSLHAYFHGELLFRKVSKRH